MFDVYICCPFERVSTCLFTKLVALLSLSVRVMHPGATLATNSSFHLTGERREDMILNQNISTIHVLCVGCTVQPARPFFSARRSQLQAGWIQPWWGDRREGAGGWLGGCCCSSCKVPFFHTGKGRSHPTTCLNMDKAVRLDAGPRWQTCSPDFCDRGAGAHWAHRSTVPLGLDFVLPYRRHDLGGPISWCGGPGCQRLPAAACLVTWPKFWSRDHPQGGRTTSNSSTKFPITSPLQSIDNSKMRDRNIYFGKTGRGLLRPLPTAIWSKNCHLFHVGPDAALQLGVGGHVAHAHGRFSVLIRNTAIASPTFATSPRNRHGAVSQWSRGWKLGAWVRLGHPQPIPTAAISCRCPSWAKAYPWSDPTARGQASETEQVEMQAAVISSRRKIESSEAAFWSHVSVT